MTIRALTLAMALALAFPTAALAQIAPPLPIPCPWWDCGSPDTEVVVEDYRVETTIRGTVATTRVTQVLRNDSEWIAEGEFLHPIPAGATVTDLVLWIDGEPVSGEVLPAGDARQTYEDIVRRVLDPALLEFVDDGLVRAAMFPIEPGDRRTVEIEYTSVLEPNGELLRFTHPLGREHASFGPVEALAATIEVELTSLKTVFSPTHAISVNHVGPDRAIVGYEATDVVPTGDLVLYVSTSETPVGIDVVSYRDGDGRGYFLLTASPGLADPEAVVAKDVAIVVDVSGSMEGKKLEQAKAAAHHVLDNLNEGDRFDVIAFSTGVTSFGGSMVTESRRDAASDWVDALAAGGSTDIAGALSEAFVRAEGRPLYVLFLTDGLPTQGIVDTTEILGLLGNVANEQISLFTFGVGFDVDTVLLDTLADDHHGASAYVIPGERIDEQVGALYAKVGTPVLTNVQLDIGGVVVSDRYPQRLPDLFSGEPIVIAGRYDGPGAAVVTLEGFDGAERYVLEDEVVFVDDGGEDAVPRVWATRKIGTLLRDIRLHGPDDETIQQIVRLSIEHGIVTPYTSYLVTEDAPFGDAAVDEIARDAAASAPSIDASGEDAVTMADTAGSMAASEVAAAVDGDLVVAAGGRAFRIVDGVWIDTTFDPEMEPTRIEFLSDDYFALAAADAGIAAGLAVGPRVILVVDGSAYEVVGAGEPADELEITEVTEPSLATTIATSVETPPATTAVTVPPLALPESTDDRDPSGLFVAITAAALAIAAGAVLVLLKR